MAFGFAAGMMVMAASQNTNGRAKNAENAKAAFPKEALTEAELMRWVVKPGQSVPEIVRPPLGSNISIEGYQSSEMELTWLTGDIAKEARCAITPESPRSLRKRKLGSSIQVNEARGRLARDP